MGKMDREKIEREIWFTYLNRTLMESGLISRSDYDKIRRCIDRECKSRG